MVATVFQKPKILAIAAREEARLVEESVSADGHLVLVLEKLDESDA